VDFLGTECFSHFLYYLIREIFT